MVYGMVWYGIGRDVSFLMDSSAIPTLFSTEPSFCCMTLKNKQGCFPGAEVMKKNWLKIVHKLLLVL